MPNIWVVYNHPKKSIGYLCFKCEYSKIGLTKLRFILWHLCKYFKLNFMCFEILWCNNVILQYVSNSYFKGKFNKILMQHVQIQNMQTWYKCEVIIAIIQTYIYYYKYHIYQTFTNVPKIENMNSVIIYTKKTQGWKYEIRSQSGQGC